MFYNIFNALVISGVDGPLPEQNNFKPPPDPVDSMIGVLNPLLALPNVSATTVANGYTVDEPTILIVSRASTGSVTTKAIKNIIIFFIISTP